MLSQTRHLKIFLKRRAYRRCPGHSCHWWHHKVELQRKEMTDFSIFLSNHWRNEEWTNKNQMNDRRVKLGGQSIVLTQVKWSECNMDPLKVAVGKKICITNPKRRKSLCRENWAWLMPRINNDQSQDASLKKCFGKIFGWMGGREGARGVRQPRTAEAEAALLRGEWTSECKRACWCGGEKTGGEERGYGCAWRWEQNVVINVIFDREPVEPRKDRRRVMWLMEGSQVMMWLAEFWADPNLRIAGVQSGQKKQLQVLSRKVRVGGSTNNKVICFNWVTELKKWLKLS